MDKLIILSDLEKYIDNTLSHMAARPLMYGNGTELEAMCWVLFQMSAHFNDESLTSVAETERKFKQRKKYSSVIPVTESIKILYPLATDDSIASEVIKFYLEFRSFIITSRIKDNDF